MKAKAINILIAVKFFTKAKGVVSVHNMRLSFWNEITVFLCPLKRENESPLFFINQVRLSRRATYCLSLKCW